MDVGSANEKRIEKIKRRIISINNEINSLYNDTNKIYKKYISQLEEVKERKLKENEKWRNDQQIAIEVEHSGAIYAIENDYQNKLNEINENIKEFTKFKSEHISEMLREPAHFFSQNGYDSSFYPPAQNPPFVDESLQFGNGLHPISEEQIAEDVKKALSIKDQKEIPQIVMNANVTIHIPFIPPISGKIVEIDDDNFVLQSHDGQNRFCLSMFRSKYATIE